MSSNKVSYFFSGNTVVKVIFETPVLAQLFLDNDFIYKYIPAAKVSATSDKYDSELTFKDEDTSFQFDTYPQVIIGAKQLSVRDVISLIELVLERSRQEKGIYCIHSASVIYHDKAIIFWGGATGMGKTRLTKTFIDFGASFYSDEKTLIDLNTFSVVGNIPFQYLEKSYWKNIEPNNGQSEYPYKKINVDRNKPSYPISLFVYGYGINGAELSSEKWEPEKFKWHMYEELSRKIRAISRKVVNGSVSVPSIDDTNNGNQRIRKIDSLTNAVSCYSIQGDPEAVINNILNIIKQDGNY